MNIFQKFKQALTVEIELEKRIDPVFGEITNEDYAWIGKVFFAPVGREVDVIIDAGEAGPTEKQRQFYKAVEQEYPRHLEAIGAALFERFRIWKTGVPRAAMWQKLELECINIPSCEATPAEWELSYWCAVVDHSFDVGLRDWDIEYISVNG